MKFNFVSTKGITSQITWLGKDIHLNLT